MTLLTKQEKIKKKIKFEPLSRNPHLSQFSQCLPTICRLAIHKKILSSFFCISNILAFHSHKTITINAILSRKLLTFKVHIYFDLVSDKNRLNYDDYDVMIT